MQTAGAMTLLTADVPFGHLLRPDVVVDGVTAVAKRTGRALHLVGRVVLHPPIGALLHIVPAPGPVPNVPLCQEDEVVGTDLGEVPLLPLAAVREGHLVFAKRHQGLGAEKSPKMASGRFVGSWITFAINVSFQRAYMSR